MKKQLDKTFNDIISLENLFLAWREFLVGKKGKCDVQIFARDLADNILALHEDLSNKTYEHGGYESFYVNDPKRRHIHKAAVRDRLLHHAVYRILYPFFEKTFIADSFSCRLGKGTHRAINRFRAMARKVGRNHTRTVWVLKCDIKKFFASIDHVILLGILKEYISDKKIIWLLENIVGSFRTVCRMSSSGLTRGSSNLDSRFRGNDKRGEIITPRFAPPLTPPQGGGEVGLPLGNLTSQLFANVYMNVFDKWVKYKLKAKNYLRYADDFIFLSENRERLLETIPQVKKFLAERLKLTLHPGKIIFKTVSSGVDFLGWVNFPRHRVLRRATLRRMMVSILENPRPETLQSYLGLLSHGNTFKICEELLMQYWLSRNV
jgi:retron-type reverse transcriptase